MCREGACCVHDELLSVFRDQKGWENEVCWAKIPSGGWVGWIVSAGDIMGGDTAHLFHCFKEGMNVPENKVDSSVMVAANVTTFNNACVIAMDPDVVLINKDRVNSMSNSKLSASPHLMSLCPLVDF